MSLHYILDAYNIMRHSAYRPKGKARDPRYGLISHVRDEGLCGSAKNRATFVFDGFPSGFEYDDGRFAAVFSGDLKADDRIKRIIESGANPRSLVIVSDDREILDFARLHRAGIERVEDFLGRQYRKAPQGEDSSKPELSYEKMHRINQEFRDRWLK